jgi:hypothetical protein
MICFLQQIQGGQQIGEQEFYLFINHLLASLNLLENIFLNLRKVVIAS